MNAKNRPPLIAFLPLLAWVALAVSGCVTPVQAAGSPTPGPTARTGTAVPTTTPVITTTAVPLPSPTPSPTPTDLPHPVCTIEWVWRDAGLTITRVDFSRLDGLAPGDLILTIDGRDAEAVIAEIETGLGGVGDPDLRRSLALDALLYGSETLLLLVRHGQTPTYYYSLVPACHV